MKRNKILTIAVMLVFALATISQSVPGGQTPKADFLEGGGTGSGCSATCNCGNGGSVTCWGTNCKVEVHPIFGGCIGVTCDGQTSSCS